MPEPWATRAASSAGTSAVIEVRGGKQRRPRPPEREDCTLTAWYRSLYAPRTGGAYDSHHRTAGIASRARRRGCVAARGGRAAGGDAGDRVSQRRVACRVPTHGGCIPSGPARIRLRRGPQRGDRISLGGGPN